MPLQIFEFSPVVSRIKELETDLLAGQSIAINYWQEELHKRFTLEQLLKKITEFKNTLREKVNTASDEMKKLK